MDDGFARIDKREKNFHGCYLLWGKFLKFFIGINFDLSETYNDEVSRPDS